MGSQALEHRLSSCGPQAWQLCSLWGLPGAVITPVSAALAGGFFTTEPPGKPPLVSFNTYDPLYLLVYCLPPSVDGKLLVEMDHQSWHSQYSGTCQSPWNSGELTKNLYLTGFRQAHVPVKSHLIRTLLSQI